MWLFGKCLGDITAAPSAGRIDLCIVANIQPEDIKVDWSCDAILVIDAFANGELLQHHNRVAPATMYVHLMHSAKRKLSVQWPRERRRYQLRSRVLALLCGKKTPAARNVYALNPTDTS